MGWDESIFGWMYKKALRFREARDSHTLLLEDPHVKGTLEHFASLVHGRSLSITSVADTGGFDGQILFLPQRFPYSLEDEDCYSLYLFKILYFIQLANQKVTPQQVIRQLQNQFPLYAAFQKHIFKIIQTHLNQQIELEDATFFEQEFLFGSNLYQSPALAVEDAKDLDGRSGSTNHFENKEDLNQKRASQVKKVDLKNQENENPFVHSFEKVHTLDQYTGGMKTQDGSDEITDHSEALGELQMDTASISTETAESILKTNYVGGYQWHANLKPQQEISAKSEFYYPEWDFKKKSYRSAWCRVVESNEAEIPTGSCIEETEKKEVRKVTDFIMALKNQRSWRTQQDDGEEIDIDSFQDALVDVRVGRTPSDRLYCRKSTTSHDWCVLILLDQSLSTESWLGDNQVLELEKKIATVLGSSFQNVGIVWGLASFYSNTRRDVHFNWIKQMGHNHFSGACLADLKPEGATRLGPILRHATKFLNKRKETKKMLLFISDTKPTDFDYYEGQYGAQDFAKALQEARETQIHFHVAALHDGAYKGLHSFFRLTEYSVIRKLEDIHSSLRKWLITILK